jgi:hypothetical protein
MQRRNGYVTPKEAQQLFESVPTVNAIRDWMKKGIPDRRNRGERIYLRCIREGSICLTRAEWVAEFQQACQLNTKARS